MKMRILAVGRLKNGAIKTICSDYVNRIRRYTNIEIIEVKDAGFKDALADRIKKDEGEALLKALPKGTKVVALTRFGKAETSRSFAQKIEQWQNASVDVSFVIGGAHGLDDRVLEYADYQWSLSELTLPHELARMTLLEQIFRACTILRGEPYHKGR